MAERAFVIGFTQTTGSVALGLSNIAITYPTGSGHNDMMYREGIFGVSVSGSSGAFGINLMAYCPDGTTMVVAGVTALAATKTVFYATNVGGTTQTAGILAPYEIQFQRAVGTSISYAASVWGILHNP